MIIGYIILLVNTSWFIWGNVIYYQENDTCNPTGKGAI